MPSPPVLPITDPTPRRVQKPVLKQDEEMGSESTEKGWRRAPETLKGVQQFRRDERWHTVPPKPDNAPRWKTPSSDGVAEGIFNGMEVDKVDPVQREIDKIELHNLKVNIADTPKRTNNLQKKTKHKEETEQELTRVDHGYKKIMGGISIGKAITKKVNGSTFIIKLTVKLPTREGSPKSIGIILRDKPSFICFACKKEWHLA